ncbi:MAG TPA: ribonuclease Z [Acidimicrobiales bacterium]|nr:ribonuclease Z [Acidimicrobiales bacterium]
MSGRELVVLGTASQAPTRARNHNGYLLRWDGWGVLFDPGEGAQRQMVAAGVASSGIDLVCITHAHGDHCLGLPGVLARMALDGRHRPVEVRCPTPAAGAIGQLVALPVGRRPFDVVVAACGEGAVRPGPPLALSARWLDHTTPALGWRLDEPDGRSLDPARLAAAGIGGAEVRRLLDDGAVHGVTVEDVSDHRPGQSVAFVMDTRRCAAAVELARGVDLLICESTFLDGDEALAAEWGHLTARQAGEVAAAAGARRLVLTHYSQRHPDEGEFARQAAEVFPDVVAARDLDRVAVPRRARSVQAGP